MKKAIKYLTEEEFCIWKNKNCSLITCDICPFKSVNCDLNDKNSWVNNKDLYTSKFLNQEIELDFKDILTNEEKEYLKNVIKPFKDSISCIYKSKKIPDKEFIRIILENDLMDFPTFTEDTMYKGMITYKRYTLKDLDLVSKKNE